MAELPHIGKHCHVCNQLDYLPITCFYCSNVLCKDHATALQHNCTPDIELKKDEIKRNKSNPEDYTKCVFCSATVTILESITCVYCRKHFCLVHRHKADHNCESIAQHQDEDNAAELQQRKAMVNNILKRLGTSAGVTVKNRGRKNDALSQRVAAMKLKSASVGQQSIPQEERIYFVVTFVPNELSYDQEHKAFKDKPIFLCKEWTVGKCVDWIANDFGLINRNNEPEQPKLVITSEKLLQEHQTDSIYLCFGHSLKDLEASKVISNNDKLMVTYFDL